MRRSNIIAGFKKLEFVTELNDYENQVRGNNVIACFVLLVIFVCVLLYGTLTSGHEWGDDFSAYIMQARSIAEGTTHDFMAANGFTIEHSSYMIGPVAYPWGVPLLMAPIYKFFGLNFVAFKMVGCVSYVLFLALLWFGLGKQYKVLWRLSLVGLFGLNPTLLGYTDKIASDLPFLFFSTLSIVFIKTTIIEQRVIISRYWDLIGLGVAIALAVFTRSNGVLLLPTLGLTQLLAIFIWPQPRVIDPKSENRQPSAEKKITFKMLWVHLLPYISFFCLFLLWEAFFPKGGASHASALQDISFSVIKAQLYYYATLPAMFFIGVPFYPLIYIASLPLAILGGLRSVRSDYHALVYTALTVLLYVVWPGTQGLRYLLPVLPFYLSFVLSGLAILQANSKGVRKQLYYVPVLGVILCFGLVGLRNSYTNLAQSRVAFTGPYTANAKQMFAYITEHTAAESRIIFVKPRLMRLMTNRDSMMINKAEALSQGDYFCQYLQTNDYDNDQVSVAIIDRLEKAGNVHKVYENSDFRIYRIKKT